LLLIFAVIRNQNTHIKGFKADEDVGRKLWMLFLNGNIASQSARLKAIKEKEPKDLINISIK